MIVLVIIFLSKKCQNLSKTLLFIIITKKKFLSPKRFENIREKLKYVSK